MRLRTRAQRAATETVAPDVYPADPADLAEPDSSDHAFHVGDQDCARCGRPITAKDEARRNASGDCVHLCC